MIPVCEGEIPRSHAWLLQFYLRTTKLPKAQLGLSLHCLVFPWLVSALMRTYKSRMSWQEEQLRLSGSVLYAFLLHGMLAAQDPCYFISCEIQFVSRSHEITKSSVHLLCLVKVTFWLTFQLSNLHLLGIGECFKVKSHRLSRHLNEFPTCCFSFFFF